MLWPRPSPSETETPMPAGTRPLTRAPLTLDCPPPSAEGISTRWALNGRPYRLTVWSARQWAQLDPRPAGAQPAPDGSYHALRAED
jgi:hypothetical protein